MDISTMGQQGLHERDVTLGARDHERRRPSRSAGDESRLTRGAEVHLLIRIRSPLDHHLDDFLGRRLVRPVDRLAHAATEKARAFSGLHLDGDVQRRHSIHVPFVDVGAGGDQELGDIPVLVLYCDRHGRNAIRIRHVHSAWYFTRICAHSRQLSRAAYMSGVSPPLLVSFARPSAVMWRCHSRTIERPFTSAPLDASNFTIAGWRRAAAHMSAVCPPNCSTAFTLAPCFRSSSAASTFPVRATSISAVWPSSFGDSTSAPASSSSFMTATLPVVAASCIGIAP